MGEKWDKLAAHERESATLGAVGALVGWDQETYMPAGAIESRAEQGGLIARLSHARNTSSERCDLIEAAASEVGADEEAMADIRELRRDYGRATKLPEELVGELATVGAKAQEAWKSARGADDFGAFEPWLAKMVELTKRKAECYGHADGGELYDALIEDYEPGMTAAEIDSIFTPLGDRLSGLIARIASDGTPPDEICKGVRIDADTQHAFGEFVIEKLGFDMETGRLDKTTHPFCSGFAPGDTRLTTRYREDDWTDALSSTMHECGHGLYEQGLRKAEFFGLPRAESVSLGIHESQSRLWENFVGRSAAFWGWLKPEADARMGATGAYSAEQYYAACNTAKPSYIRVESDEATYNLHVMLRFGIERDLMSGSLSVADVPGAWNERFEKLLGLKVPGDAQGCLQDVHWSFGLFGYFPTYTLGNLYAAQLWEAIGRDLGDVDGAIGRGDFAGVLGWLREKIHAPGRRWTAKELAKRATGEELSAEPLLAYLERKLLPVYGL